MSKARNRVFLAVAVMIAVVPLYTVAIAQGHDHSHGDPTNLGQVHFPTSCDKAVQAEFDRAVALLHSFWYEKAAETFRAVAAKDATCAMAHWGVAMTQFRPLWEPPNAESMKIGKTAIESARAASAKTERERGYIEALAQFYDGSDRLDHRTRVAAYEKAIGELAAKHPDDTEAAIFHALALLGVGASSPADKTFARQKQAGKILEPIFARQPEHPGVAHYIIHAYDFPPLASEGVAAARRYAKIAPDSPHALHMPSHIFTRLGMWDDCISSNTASAASGRKHNSPGDELHALDYLVYAYLQQGRDDKAREIAGRLPSIENVMAMRFAGLYATAAVPARLALERHDWRAAAALKAPAVLAGNPRYAWTEGNFLFANALGAARLGDLDAARAAVAGLGNKRDALVQAGEKYWADQVEVQRRSAEAWLAFAEGRKEDALQVMRSAADLEDSMEKHPVTPGALLPARELLGDMLLELKKPAEAIAEYQTSLKSSPNRFHSLLGAARAAEQAGRQAEARQWYGKLLNVAGQGQRSELQQARRFVESGKTGGS